MGFLKKIQQQLNDVKGTAIHMLVLARYFKPKVLVCLWDEKQKSKASAHTRNEEGG